VLGCFLWAAVNAENAAAEDRTMELEAVKLDLEIRELCGSVPRSWVSTYVALAMPLVIAGLGLFISQAAERA
jgi:hypothetical protein